MPNTALNRSAIVLLTNKSGGAVAYGDVVILDAANADAFTTTTTAAYASGAKGVVLEPLGIAADAQGLVIFYGWVPRVNLSASASIGQLINTHTVAGQATPHSAPPVEGDFGQVLGTGTTPAAIIGLLGAVAASSSVTDWPPLHFSGLSLTNNTGDANNDIDIGIGGCRDGANAYNMTLSSVLTKRLDAAWAVGNNNGGLDTGAKANSTWYHMYLIRKDADGSIDALFTATYGSPTMPAGYSTKRHIGAVLTNGTGNIRGFSQRGNIVSWNDSTLALNASNLALGTAAISVTLTVPTGLQVLASFNVQLFKNAASYRAYVSALDTPDLAPSTSAYPLENTPTPPTSAGGLLNYREVTNTSGQVRFRGESASGAVWVATMGWEYLRQV